jgi:hypothetical protein
MEEKNNNIKRRMTIREVVKINVIIEYGKEEALKIAEALKCKNTEEKLNSIYNILDCHKINGMFTDNQLLFIVQKLLGYPYKTRISISEQICKRLEETKE